MFADAAKRGRVCGSAASLEQRALAAREEALAAIGARVAALTRRLVELDAGRARARPQPRQSPSQALLDLALDWHRWHHSSPVQTE